MIMIIIPYRLGAGKIWILVDEQAGPCMGRCMGGGDVMMWWGYFQ